MTSVHEPLLPANLSLPGYSVVECLYQATGTTVYRAVETATQQSVVVKALSLEHPSFNELIQFRNQYTVAKNLPIDGIIRPLSLVPYGNGYALVMEDFGGIDLGQYAQQGALSLTEVLDIGIQLASTLHDLHQHWVIHKDIKPSNILIHPDSNQVKLIDFSIASLLTKEIQAIQSPDNLEGTLAYLAPEQTGRMNRAIDYRTDFYGLGVTLYQLLTGQLPFTSEHPLELIHCHMAQIPTAVDQVNPDVPAMVAAIVSKLMAKNAEDRYQSAFGLKHDLVQCLTQWKEHENITEFRLGQRDICDRFLIPEKLYGREVEIQTLLDAFERVSQDNSELMLVTGFSGIGKTAVINEVHKPITRQNGYFIKGKFDQFNRNIPFSAFVQAFRNLLGQLLSESDRQLATWKAKILTALGKNGQVLIDVIPELENIIGAQPAVSELSGSAAQNRLNLLFQKFITVFSTPEHPLVIFLDDLQWADSASLNLLNLIMTESGMGHLLILGAYRDNEVSPAHPLTLLLEDIRQQQSNIHTITLKPLATEYIHHLVADTLLCSTELAAPLAELVYQKTQGNPFFTTQFLYGLHEESLITIDSSAGYWTCDLTQIQQLALTNDVIEFMVRRLQKLPPSTQAILKLAACIGNQFDLETLAVVCERPQHEVAIDLWRTLQDGLVIPENNTYKFFQGDSCKVEDTAHEIRLAYRFLHDRVQQAAYALIAKENKPLIHLKIGQLLLAQQSSQTHKRNLFKVVNNLNKGIGLIDDDLQQQQLASLNLEAGQQAKSSMAYVEAVAYIEQGINLLLPQGWNTRYALSLELYSELAEVHFLRGDFEAVEAVSTIALKHIQDTTDALPIYIAQISSNLAQGKMSAGYEVGIEVLSSLGVQIASEISERDTQRKQYQILTEFKAKTIQEFISLPQNHDPHFLELQDLLTVMVGYAYKAKPELLTIIIGEQISLLMRHGNIPASASIYALYGMLLCGSQDFESGYFAGEVALAVMQAFPCKRFEMRVRNLIYSYIKPWKKLLKDSIDPIKQGFALGLETGDIEYTVYGINHYAQFLYFSGANLATVDREIATYQKILDAYRQESMLRGVQIFHQTVLNLIHVSDVPWQLEGDIFQESKYVPNWQINHLDFFLAALYINKLVLSVLFGNPAIGLDYACIAHESHRGLTGEFQLSYLHCYRALAHLAVLTSLSSEKQAHGLTQVALDLEKLEQFASHAPMNFQHQVDLIQAERHRVLGQRLEAMDAYDRAITLAKVHGYIQEEALANELAAKFYLDWGKEKVAADYIQEAYYCYSRWGATAKVTNLETHYPKLLRPVLQSSASSGDVLTTLMTLTETTTSVYASTHHRASSTSLNQTFDFASILKAAQALSGTIQLDDLLHQLTQLILQNSGGNHCALLLPNETDVWQVRAVATIDNTQLCTEPLTNNPNLPVKLIQYVKNTREVVVIDNLETDLPVLDDFLIAHQPKSLLCLPLLNQGHLIGILYLNNKLTSGVFTRDRITIINFLCTQTAISLENARLYQLERHRADQLAASENRLQTLFDQAADAVFLLEEQRIIDCNQAAVNLLRYSNKTELLDLHPHQFSPKRQPDGQLSAVKIKFMLLEASQRCSFRFEWVLQRGDGENFWAEITLTPIKYQGKIILHCITRDISDRKVAEKKLRTSEQRYATLAAAAPVGIFRTDALGHCIYVNNRWCQIAGLTPEAAAGYGWQQGLHPDDRDLITAEWYQSIQENRPFRLEYRFQRQDGQITWVYGQSIAEQDAEGQVIGYVGTITDISDRKAAEQKLLESQTFLKTVLDTFPLSIFWKDRESSYIGVNQNFAQDAGFKEAIEIAGLTDFDMPWAETEAQDYRADDQEVMTLGIPKLGIIETQIQADGTQVWIETNKLPLRDLDGNVIGVMGTYQDISDRKQAEANSRLLASVVESSDDAIITKSLDSIITSWNQAAVDLFGYTETEAIGQSIIMLFPADRLQEEAQIIARIKNKERIKHFETVRLHKNRTPIDISVTISPLVDSYGNVVGASKIVRDIRDRKQAEAQIHRKNQELEIALTQLQQSQLQLVKSEKMSALGSLVAGIAHEINNPIGCIVGNVDATEDYFSDLLGLLDLYTKRFPDPGTDIENQLDTVDLAYVRDDLPQLIRAMKDSGERIVNISRSLRTFSRADTETRQVFDLHKGLESTILILRHRLKANEQRPTIEVVKEFDDLPEIACFPGQLNQVFMNVLVNAIDALDEASQQFSNDLETYYPRIKIRTELRQQQVTIAIADNGLGIPEGLRTKVFDSLFTTKGVGKGTGLGLAIARQIVVDTHGGSLEVQSDVGQGTEFCIRLPR